MFDAGRGSERHGRWEVRPQPSRPQVGRRGLVRLGRRGHHADVCRTASPLRSCSRRDDLVVLSKHPEPRRLRDRPSRIPRETALAPSSRSLLEEREECRVAAIDRGRGAVCGAAERPFVGVGVPGRPVDLRVGPTRVLNASTVNAAWTSSPASASRAGSSMSAGTTTMHVSSRRKLIASLAPRLAVTTWTPPPPDARRIDVEARPLRLDECPDRFLHPPIVAAGSRLGQRAAWRRRCGPGRLRASRREDRTRVGHPWQSPRTRGGDRRCLGAGRRSVVGAR